LERINQYSFYELGRTLKQIASYGGNIAPASIGFEIFPAIAAVDQLLKGDPVPLGVSRTAAQELQQAIQDIIDNHFKGPANPDGTRDFKWPAENDPPIPSWRFDWIRNNLQKFETIFSAEMREAATYFVPRRGIFSTEALVDKADESFPAALARFIPEKAKVEWRAAGRCLAFNLLSASGFHVARAVEGTLEVYWRKFSGADANATLRSWHDYVKSLSEIATKNPTPSPAPKTLAEMSQMKDDYRNPIMHPRVVLSEADSRMLFDNGESLIIAMADELRVIEEEQGGVQGALTVVSGGASP
jgi:hypothetical protein